MHKIPYNIHVILYRHFSYRGGDHILSGRTFPLGGSCGSFLETMAWSRLWADGGAGGPSRYMQSSTPS